MPRVFGIPLIAWIQMVIGAAVVLFMLFKYLTRPKAVKKGEYLIRDVHVIVGDGSEAYHQNVLIRDGMIAKISDQPIGRKNVQIIEGEGKTLMPGLIDSHIHIQGGLNNRSEEESDRFLNETLPQIFRDKILPYGITTIKDLDAPKHFIYKLSQKLASGEITGPELLLVGPNFTAPDGHPANTLGGDNPWARAEMALEVTTPEQVTAGIRELKEAGVDFLKFTYQGGDFWYFDNLLTIQKIDPALMRQIIREGKENGLDATAHVFYYDDVKELLEAGIYGIEHGIVDRDIEPGDDIIRLWKESGARFVPTVNAMTYEKEPTRMGHSIHNLKVLYDAGIPIAMGTDNMFETMGGDVEHKELAYYVEAGLTPMQAIVLATKNGAEHLGIADRKGQVREGMEADLILLDKDPAENIANMQFIERVFLKGKIVFSQKPIQSYDIPDYDYPEDLAAAEYVNADGTQRRELRFERYAGEKLVTQITYHGEEKWSEEEFCLEKNLSSVKWHYLRPSDDTDIRAFRENGSINMSGSFKGKAQDKSFQIGEGLWYQMMDMCFPAFIGSSLDEIVFYSIGTGDNRGAMSLGEFAAKRLGKEEITINGTRFSCEKVSLVLTMFSWAWTGLFWYDEKTGQLVQSSEKKNGKETVDWRLKALTFR